MPNAGVSASLLHAWLFLILLVSISGQLVIFEDLCLHHIAGRKNFSPLKEENIFLLLLPGLFQLRLAEHNSFPVPGFPFVVSGKILDVENVFRFRRGNVNANRGRSGWKGTIIQRIRNGVLVLGVWTRARYLPWHLQLYQSLRLRDRSRDLEAFHFGY